MKSQGCQTSNTQPPRGYETVLLVMSEPAVRHYFSWILRELGYHVIEAHDGEEALCLFHQNPNRYVDLLLADAVIPRMGGKQLAHKLAGLLPTSRMVLTSPYPAELAIHNNLLSADLAYIQKPVTRQALAHKVREVIDAANQEALLFVPVEELEAVAVA